MDKNLDSYLSSYSSFNDWLINRRYLYLKQFFKGNSCLELGIAEGTGVSYLLDAFDEVTVVDGSQKAIASIKKQFPTPKLNAVNAYFEKMKLGEKKFDTIIMAHILEHVDDPVGILVKIQSYMHKDSVVIIDVPNGNSLHRQIGVKMGLLKEKTDLNSADRSIGHKRVYTPETFKKDIEKAGLKINKSGGMFTKVLSNAQMETSFNESQREALFEVGLDNPEIAAEIFIVAESD